LKEFLIAYEPLHVKQIHLSTNITLDFIMQKCTIAKSTHREAELMLNGKQKRLLRALGHSLKPVVRVGKNEINSTLTEETIAALAAHELIKIKLLESCEMDRHEVAATLAKAADAEVAQILGRTILLYRQGEKPKIELPVK